MRVLGLLLLAGCNQVFDLAGTELIPTVDAPDAPVLPDLDQDGVPDREDNCPDVANPIQGDADADTFGDACDNCPVIANPGQEHLGDSDAIGDLCDPHPLEAGDCLILLDTFRDPDVLSHWLVRPTTPATVLTPMAGGLVFDPPDTKRTTIVPLMPGGAPFHGVFDVILLASTEETAGTIGIAATTNLNIDEAFTCSVRFGTDVYMDFPTYALSTRLSVDHIAPNLIIRISVRDAAALMPRVACRVDYGIAVGTLEEMDRPPTTVGEPGILGQVEPATLQGFALYQPATSCPTPTIR